MREEARVSVDGVEERWRLVWREPPKPICHDTNWGGAPCACWPFDYAEAGNVDLVRMKDGAKIDTLDASALVGEVSDYELWLPHWRRAPKETRDAVPLSEAKKGDVITLMRPADYDHDGRATEFTLLTNSGAGPCGHYANVIVVGITKRNPRLHAFTTVEGSVLRLRSRDDWDRVAHAKPGEKIRIDDFACGDHGATESQFRNVWFDVAGLHEESKTGKCE